MYRPQIESFSDGYYIFSDARVLNHGGERAVVAHDTLNFLSRHMSEPLLKVGSSHYWPKGEQSVPPDVVALPASARSSESDSVLVAKENTVRDLIDSGVV